MADSLSWREIDIVFQHLSILSLLTSPTFMRMKEKNKFMAVLPAKVGSIKSHILHVILVPLKMGAIVMLDTSHKME